MQTPLLIGGRSHLPSRRLLAVVLILVPLALFSPAFYFDFIDWDDPLYVMQNPLVQGGVTPENLTLVFTRFQAGYWIPLTWISHMLDIEWFGMRPGLHHVTNVALHCLNTLLVFLVFQPLTHSRLQSFFIALLFAVHPMGVENVAWIAERKGLLSTCFGLLCCRAYLHFAARPGKGRMAVVLLFYLASLLAKPMLVTLPFLFLVWDALPLRRWNFSFPGMPLREKTVLFLVTFLFCALTLYTQHQGQTLASLQQWGVEERLLTMPLVYRDYLVKFFQPWPQMILYPHNFTAQANREMFMAAGLLAALTAACLLTMRRAPGMMAGWLWFLGSLVPMVGLAQSGVQLIADRFMYFPKLGLLWMLTELLFQRNLVSGRLPLLRLGTLSTIAALWVVLTAGYLPVFKDSQSVWEHTLRHSGDQNAMAHLKYGVFLMERNQSDLARNHFTRALEINPGFVEAHINLGVIYEEGKDMARALDHYLAALSLNPAHPIARINFANVLFFKRQWVEALAEYQKTLELAPHLADAHLNLAITYSMLGDFKRAEEGLLGAILAHPDLYEIGVAFGRFLEDQRHFTQARSFYTRLGSLSLAQQERIQPRLQRLPPESP